MEMNCKQPISSQIRAHSDEHMCEGMFCEESVIALVCEGCLTLA